MIDLITPFMNWLWPLAAAVAGLLGLLLWGAKKKREGREDERARAYKAQVDATARAEAERTKAAAKPIDTRRKETSKWER